MAQGDGLVFQGTIPPDAPKLRQWEQALRLCKNVRNTGVRDLDQCVVDARRDGCSWRFIAECLDEPFQTVHSRYSKLVGTR
jgi:hypothetical protein